MWGELPMTGTGKIDKKAIRAKLASRGYLLPDQRAGGAGGTAKL